MKYYEPKAEILFSQAPLRSVKGYGTDLSGHLHKFRVYVIDKLGPVEDEYYPVAICTGMPPVMPLQYLALAPIPPGDGSDCHTTCPCLA